LRNNKGETPFHIAAREGHIETVRSLIEFAKTELPDRGNDMMRLTNADGDTALHDAVRFEKLDVVKLLVREDPEFLHPLNKVEETPLYLAAEKGLEDFVSEILKNCKSASYIGPQRRTALHAAVIFGWKGIFTALTLVMLCHM
jgi:ankyrin repeat protein